MNFNNKFIDILVSLKKESNNLSMSFFVNNYIINIFDELKKSPNFFFFIILEISKKTKLDKSVIILSIIESQREDIVKYIVDHLWNFLDDNSKSVLAKENKIPFNFMKKCSKNDFNLILMFKKVPEFFIEKNKDKVNWMVVSQSQKLSESFIEKYSDKLNWILISQYQKLSENFIEKNKKRVFWTMISKYQKLSEKFIEKFKYKVDWEYISMYQELTLEFIERNKDFIKLSFLKENQKIKPEMMEYIIKNIYKKNDN